MSQNPAQQLVNYGQSIWYDNISRDLIESGDLAKLVAEKGVRGITSNPTIFEKAIKGSATYDQSIAEGAKQNLSTDQIFEQIAVTDIGSAADILLPIYKESCGTDGFVSIEVSPLLACDTEGSVTEAVRLYKKLNRPNIMIKIPGTKEGIPAIYSLLKQGISINVTLLFSVENYLEVAKAYCRAVKDRLAEGNSVSALRSVASFFVSRVDTAVDKQLGEIIKNDSNNSEEAQALLAKYGIANCQIVYQEFKKIFECEEFKALEKQGATPQRPLWASTSTKNPEYSDVLYVDSLIGQNTVNTLPPNTLDAFADHGTCKETIEDNLEFALSVPGRLEALGINLKKILTDLQTDGVKSFSESFVSLNKAIEEKI